MTIIRRKGEAFLSPEQKEARRRLEKLGLGAYTMKEVYKEAQKLMSAGEVSTHWRGLAQVSARCGMQWPKLRKLLKQAGK
ncbi:MAG: hypothetical protein WDA20_11455 [Desulfuromonadales bacterium]|jgi:hypothetical protein